MEFTSEKESSMNPGKLLPVRVDSIWLDGPVVCLSIRHLSVFLLCQEALKHPTIKKMGGCEQS